LFKQVRPTINRTPQLGAFVARIFSLFHHLYNAKKTYSEAK